MNILGQNFDIETVEMNVVELACVYGHHDALAKMIDKMNLRSPRDFQM